MATNQNSAEGKRKGRSLHKEPWGDEGTILINFVLDKSGSMDSIRAATISGFNEFKNDQSRESGQAVLSLTLFDTEFFGVCQAVPMREVPDLELETYVPGGCTARYDAIGHTMRMTDDFVAANKPDQVLFVIMTDGMENASREFSRERIFQMIEDRRKLANYEFVYLGANQDSYSVGASIGVAAGHTLDYRATPEAAKKTMKRVSDNVRAHRRYAEHQSPVWFTEALEADGALEPEEWEQKKQAGK